jgi:hypothetical protein
LQKQLNKSEDLIITVTNERDLYKKEIEERNDKNVQISGYSSHLGMPKSRSDNPFRYFEGLDVVYELSANKMLKIGL